MFVTFSARFHTSALRALKPQEKHEIPMPFQRKPSSSFAGKSPSENLSLTPETSSKKPCPTPARNHARKTCQTKKMGGNIGLEIGLEIGRNIGRRMGRQIGRKSGQSIGGKTWETLGEDRWAQVAT